MIIQRIKEKIFSFLMKLTGVPDYMIVGNYKKIRLDRDIANFSNIASKIVSEGRTLLGIDRLYTIWQAISKMPPNSNILEVGVYRGGSSKFISLVSSIFHPKTLIDVVDTFQGHAQTSDIDGKHEVGKQFSNVNLKNVFAYLKGCPRLKIHVGDIKVVSKKLGNGEDLGFVHVDVDVYDASKFSLNYAFSRLKPNGFIIVDDYGFTTCKGAKLATEEFLDSHETALMFHLTTGQCLITKLGEV